MHTKITNVKALNHASIKGFFTLEFTEIGLKIVDCKLILLKNGKDYFIGFPSQKLEDGSYRNFIFLDKDKKESQEIQDDIIIEVIKQLK
jgi:DNA-binding cell septation regulator SpoVG